VSLNKLSPAEVAQRAAYEYIPNKRDWWYSAIDLVAQSRAEASPRYEEYVRFLRRFLLADVNNATGFSVTGLNEGQKWLLMIIIDVFADHMIITYDTFEEWLPVWRSITERLLPGFDAILKQPDLLDPAQLNNAWNELRAAVS
jgi:hypothetical protein